ncbi:6,7-dimethyl-8-ribityllumazine synthase [Sedimentimonas flavescens]|uniref:6,7-dimethyl-8-ribityllumazine synthase n=1 Tax=Sedimentimonas flavescens TaxID=2851012 RepID=A0ABT2ZUY4_9RHOB|nr:6,7-dimethyl-8-ribityllumazine synthase [Sedimentimonas flavescens]MBW0156661.1 6,7-dimethyl-8-ribityllumazine synthase [Sedimentimonas flavescens]MCT2539155.1 6,7-dimethyl-8-ribityllumazine synthase [Sedimentimonas flavescens]MCV2877565.1 6,7-dimethyl-8-ribityllumazine synthase [Sedimentimonas flavescens]WBL32426.1 6,7-dimethyl-8-ribityllumazine synthase [Sinirhodobacter sp. HNIBRBA609]
MAGHELHYTPPMPSFDKPVRLLIVVAPYYKDIADNLVAGAMAVAAAAGATVDLVEVPGALEVPTAIAMASRMADYDGYVALGCVIRGETTHYDTVCNDSSRGLTMLGLQGVCLGNGILTVENRKQAEVRADPADQNKGGGAAAAALHLVALSRKWAGRTKGIGFRPQGESFRIAGETEGPSQA